MPKSIIRKVSVLVLKLLILIIVLALALLAIMITLLYPPRKEVDGAFVPVSDTYLVSELVKKCDALYLPHICSASVLMRLGAMMMPDATGDEDYRLAHLPPPMLSFLRHSPTIASGTQAACARREFILWIEFIAAPSNNKEIATLAQLPQHLNSCVSLKFLSHRSYFFVISDNMVVAKIEVIDTDDGELILATYYFRASEKEVSVLGFPSSRWKENLNILHEVIKNGSDSLQEKAVDWDVEELPSVRHLTQDSRLQDN